MTFATTRELTLIAQAGFEVDHGKGQLVARLRDLLGSPLKVIRVSPVRIICVATSEHSLNPKDQVTFGLRYEKTESAVGPIHGTVTYLERTGKMSQVTIELDTSCDTSARMVGSMITDILKAHGFTPPPMKSRFKDVATDPKHVREVLHALIAHGADGVAVCGDDSSCIRNAKAMRYEPDSTHPFQWRIEEPWPKAPFELEINSYTSMYRIPVQEFERQDDSLAMMSPQKLVRYRARSTRRLLPYGIKIGFKHPQFEELRVSRRAVNVSQYGLAFVTRIAEDLVYPGLELPAIVVTVGDKSTLVQGVVRHVSLSHKQDSVVCGVEIICPSPFHPRLGWANIIEPFLHQTTSRGGTTNVDDVWNLYDKSGYFQLSGKHTEDFHSLKDSYKEVCGHFGDTPALGCQVLWDSHGRLEATASVALVYSGSWLFYQLARRKGRSPVGVPGRQLVRDVYIHAFEHAQWYPSLNWMISYIEANVRWHKLTHHAFAERHANTGKVLNLPFRLMEDRSATRQSDQPYTYEIGEATMEELELFIEHVRRKYPPAVVDALDYSPANFYLEDVNAILVAARLSRTRTMYVARKNGKPIAAAIYETGSAGMHLFRLVDGVRLFDLAPRADDALRELIEHARDWYAQKGKDTFIYYMDEDKVELGLEAKFTDLGAGYMWLIHKSLISDFIEHIHRFTAPRDVAPLEQQIPGKES